MADWTFYIETYGCKVNQYETQILREAWQARGGMEVDDASHADYILINSCAITAKAERDMRNAVFRLRRLSSTGRIILTGCAAQFFPQYTPRKNTFYAAPDYCVTQNNKNLLHDGPQALKAADIKDISPVKLISYKRSRPVVKIQDGCTQGCAYCVVPQTRPALCSGAPCDILAQCQSLFGQGFGEIVLSGINLRQYGLDNPAYGNFWDLLKFLDDKLSSEFEGKGRLRISSIEPAQLTSQGLDTLANCRLLCPHLHLSLQHASNAVLKSMGRNHYKTTNILNFMRQLRNVWPDMALGADILVGFPGETEEDIEILKQFVSEIAFSYAHVFPYSSRPGTKAANFTGQLEQKLKKARAAQIRQVIDIQKRKFWLEQLKKEIVTIAPENDAIGQGKGFNEFYVPCLFEPQIFNHKGLVKAKPVKITKTGIEVTILNM